MAKRVKKATTPALRSRQEMEECVERLERLVIERDGMHAEMDVRLADIRAQYQERLGEMDEELKLNLGLAEEWCGANAETFGPRKSLDLTHGTVGFRSGMPRLKTLRGITWPTVLEMLARTKMWDYVRTKSEPNKEKLLADREELGGRLRELGVEVTQDESFFFQPKREGQAVDGRGQSVIV